MNRTKISASLLVGIVTSLNAMVAPAEMSPPEISLPGHSAMVYDLAFSPDGKRLASVGDDGKLRIWDIAGKKELFTIDGVHTNSNRVRYTPDGKWVLTLSSDNTVLLVDPETGKLGDPIKLPNQAGGAEGLDLSPDGKTVAVTGRGSFLMFDLATRALKGTYPVHVGYGVPAIAFCADGKTLATVGTDNAASVVDAATGAVISTIKVKSHGVGVALSTDGKTLFAATDDRVLRSYDVATGADKTLVEKRQPILSISLSKDGKLMAVGGIDRSPWLVKLPEGELLDPAYVCEDWIKCVALSADGQWLAGGAHGGPIHVWKMAK